MNTLLAMVILLVAAVAGDAAEVVPERPTPAQIAKVLSLERSRVSADTKELHPKLEGKVLWMATYQITGNEGCTLTITVFPNDRIKTEFIEKVGAQQGGFKKITQDNGDVVYSGLGDSGHMGTFYMTTLINHENDWDMTLTLSRDEGVDESKLPVAIAKDGVKLIGSIESLLRKTKEAQQGAPQNP